VVTEESWALPIRAAAAATIVRIDGQGHGVASAF